MSLTLNRFTLLLFTILLITSFTSAKDVALVVSSSPNANVVSTLNSLGYDYDVIMNSQIPSANFSSYAILLVQDSVTNRNLLPVNTKNLIFLDINLVPVVWNTWDASPVTTMSTAQIKQIIPPFTNNLSLGQYSCYNALRTSYYVRKEVAGPSVAITGVSYSIRESSQLYPIVAYSENNSHRIVFYGFNDPFYWSADSIAMFKNSLAWVRTGVDNDNDGFFSDTDCNDNNPNVNPNAIEIAYNGIDDNCDGFDLTDVDLDGFNSTLVLGGIDCDDSNASINPNSNDLRFNCRNDAPQFTGSIANLTWNEDTSLTNAIDLNNYFNDPELDVLNFSVYDSTSDKNISVIFNSGNVSFSVNSNWFGEDWVVFESADNGSLFNITNKIYLKVLPVNDAPTLQNIINIGVSEGQNVTITANASDVDGDTLTYSINDSIFTKTNNIFTWQTNHLDSGIYYFLVSVSDGILNASKQVRVNVADINQPPTISEISNKVIDEDTNSSFIVSASDVDLDVLSYSIIEEDTSKVNCDFMGTSVRLTPASNWNGNTSCTIQVSDSHYNVTKSFNITVNPVNDAPISLSGKEIYILAGNVALAEVSASDIEGDSISFSYSSPFNSTGSWQTSISDIGNRNISFNAIDGNGASSAGSFMVHVLAPILINEVELNDGSEWVELYNPLSSDVNISGWQIWDRLVTSTDRYTFNEVIKSNEYSVVEVHGLNNDGEYVDLIYQNITIDSTPLLVDTVGDVNTWQREPNGGEDWTFKKMTKNMSNDVDTMGPVITLISPNNYVSNTDKITFNYSVYDNNALTLNCSLYSNVNATFPVRTVVNGSSDEFYIFGAIADGDYFWNMECSDGINSAFASNNLTFTVNDTPYVIQTPGTLVWDEDNNLTINLSDYVKDDDNSSLGYSLNSHSSDAVSVTFNDNIVTLIPIGDWFGTENVSFKACDNEKCVNLSNFELVVNPVNDAPVVQNIADITVQEGDLVTIDVQASDVDTDFSIYSINDSRFNQVNNLFTWQTNLSDGGIYYFEINVSDGILSTKKVVKVNVGNNIAPVIDSFLPSSNPLIAETGSQQFSVVYHDLDSNNLTVQWYLDNVHVANGSSYTFIGDGSVKSYEIKVIVSDSEFEASKEWTLTTNNLPITSKYSGETTNFVGMTDPQLSLTYLILEKLGFGKIEFLDPVDMRDVVDLDSNSDIQHGLAGINSDVFNAFKNKKAKITFYNLVYNKTPTIYYDGSYNMNSQSSNICPDTVCSDISYQNNNLQFTVSGFSTFIVGDTRTCSQKSGFICASNQICRGSLIESRDSDRCCNVACIYDFNDEDTCSVANSNIEISIKDPDNNDEFNIVENISGEVKVYNKFSDDKDFNVKVSLYDITEDNSVETFDDTLSIDSKDSETLEFDLKIPSDLEENNDYTLYVYVEDDDNSTLCNSNYINLDIQREKHNVVVSKFYVSGKPICGEDAEASIDLQNLGRSKEEDVSLIFEIEDLGILVKTEEFNLNKFEENNDELEKTISFKIPSNASAGTYSVKLKVSTSDSTQTFNNELVLGNCIKTEVKETIAKKVIFEEDKSRPAMFSNLSNSMKLFFLNLFMAIAVVVILISIVLVRRNLDRRIERNKYWKAQV